MTRRSQWILVAAIIAALAGGAWSAVRLFGDELFPVSVGSHAPRFRATTVDSVRREKSLDDYRGQVVLLNIWATWCEPCRVEMPSIQRVYRDLGPEGLKVVAVSIDEPGAEAAIRGFAREYSLEFELLHDPSGAIKDLYQTTGVPETFVIGRDGVIRKKVIGAADWSSPPNRALFARLLAEPGPS